jgi:hypothetical protein
MCGLRSRQGPLKFHDPRPYFMGEAAHLRLERLELQHEGLNPQRVKIANPPRDGVVAAHQARSGAAVGADMGQSCEGLEHHSLGIGVSRGLRPQRRVLFRQFEGMHQFFLCLGIGLPRDHEGRKAEANRGI